MMNLAEINTPTWQVAILATCTKNSLQIKLKYANNQIAYLTKILPCGKKVLREEHICALKGREYV